MCTCACACVCLVLCNRLLIALQMKSEWNQFDWRWSDRLSRSLSGEGCRRTRPVSGSEPSCLQPVGSNCDSGLVSFPAAFKEKPVSCLSFFFNICRTTEFIGDSLFPPMSCCISESPVACSGHASLILSALASLLAVFVPLIIVTFLKSSDQLPLFFFSSDRLLCKMYLHFDLFDVSSV